MFHRIVGKFPPIIDRIGTFCGGRSTALGLIHELKVLVPFVSLKKQAETLFQLICCKRKILFQLKKQAKKYGLQDKRIGPLDEAWDILSQSIYLLYI